MSKKDFVFSVMLGFFIMATLLNLIISIVTGDIMVWMCTVLDLSLIHISEPTRRS